MTAVLSPSQTLARAERELRDLWITPPERGQMPRTRACTMNLVVVAATPHLAHADVIAGANANANANPWVAIVDEVTQRVPARAIVVGLDPDAADAIDASVVAVCTRGDGAVICSERVTLGIRGILCGRLASCVDALCSADVPTTLVWLARVRVEDPAFAPLARSANRVVLDAGSGSLSGLAHVVQWARERPTGERPGIADLAWTRLVPWHEHCARMFDEARLRALTATVTRVRLVQAARAGDALGPEVSLMLGWLATRLGWKASSLAGKLRLLRADGVHLPVELHAEDVSWTGRGSLLTVELDARRGDTTMRGTVTRAPAGSGVWRLEVSAGGETQKIEQQVHALAISPAALLERTLRRPVYDDALAESVAWADALGSDELACA